MAAASCLVLAISKDTLRTGDLAAHCGWVRLYRIKAGSRNKTGSSCVECALSATGQYCTLSSA